MPIVTEMRSLTDDLVRSYEQRMEGIATRRESVANTLASANRSRAEMAVDQRVSLAKATADRQVHVQAMMRSNRSARVADEADLHARLNLDRAGLFEQVSDLLSEISHARSTATAEQEEALAQGHAKLVIDTASFVGAAHDAHEAMAKSQREALDSGRTALHAEVNATLGAIHTAREALASNLAEFRQVWQNFAEAMQGRRSGAVDSPPPEAGKKADQPTVAQPKAAAPTAEAHTEAGGMPSDESIFRYLADHPDGLRLVELEEYFGIARIRMANVLNRLIEENKARKDEERKLYFAS